MFSPLPASFKYTVFVLDRVLCMAGKKKTVRKAVGAPASGGSSEGNLWGTLAYLIQIFSVIGWVGAVLIYLVKKDSFTRFHALQAVLLSIAFAIIAVVLVVSVVGLILMPIVSVIALILWLYMLYKSYSGEKVMLPLIGGIAAQHS